MMKNIKNKNIFLVICSSCIVVLLMICYFGFNIYIKGTWAHFDGASAVITPTFTITYYSNWPVEDEEETQVDKSKQDYVILNNLFNIPSGYEFIGWNTKSDGSGDEYSVNQSVFLKYDLKLYAQWTSVVIDDTLVIVYGDVNQNGDIDEDDYLLIEKYLSGSGTLSSQSLLNSDVNADGVVDSIDVDIIKQAYLGTDGYVGYLPDKSIPIYELYSGNSNEDTSEDNVDDGEIGTENNTDGSNVSGEGNGTNSGSVGNGNSNVPAGGSGSSGGNHQGSDSSDNGYENGSKAPFENVDSSSNPTIKKYEFKFMNGTDEYDITECEVLGDDSCELVLPENNPAKDGYKFNGWSLDIECSTGSGTLSPVIVNSGNIYYACFVEIDDVTEENNKSYVGIIVVALCALSGRIIYQIIYCFIKKENLEENND